MFGGFPLLRSAAGILAICLPCLCFAHILVSIGCLCLGGTGRLRLGFSSVMAGVGFMVPVTAFRFYMTGCTASLDCALILSAVQVAGAKTNRTLFFSKGVNDERQFNNENPAGVSYDGW